jgi:hypothetical protein
MFICNLSVAVGEQLIQNDWSGDKGTQLSMDTPQSCNLWR